MIDLDPTYLAEVKKIIASHFPQVTAKVFGSRVTGKAKANSDLDIVLIDKQAIPIDKLNDLKFDFSNSDLPILVDIVDWHTISDSFRAKIEPDCETLLD